MPGVCGRGVFCIAGGELAARAEYAPNMGSVVSRVRGRIRGAVDHTPREEAEWLAWLERQEEQINVADTTRACSGKNKGSSQALVGGSGWGACSGGGGGAGVGAAEGAGTGAAAVAGEWG